MRARGLACAARLLARGDATTAPARWMGIASAFRVDPPAANAPWSLDAKRHASRWPFPKSGGVEGFPDQYMRTIKKRVVPANGTEGEAEAVSRSVIIIRANRTLRPAPSSRFAPNRHSRFSRRTRFRAAARAFR
jgi:hypothetical protein